MLQQLSWAWIGYLYWNLIKARYKIRAGDVVLFLVDRDREWNAFAYLHAEEFRQKKLGARLVFVSPYKDVLRQMPGYLKKYRQICISSRQCESIKRYYQLVNFSDNVCFVSKDWPESNWLGRLLDRHGINQEDLICLGIYGMREIRHNDL